MNMSLIIMEGHSGAIDSNDSTCHSYYIRFYDHIFGIVRVSGSVWQRYKKPQESAPWYKFK